MNNKGIDCLGDNGVCVPVTTYKIKKRKKQTWGDKIRSMSDEELAIFLINFKNTFGEEYEGEMSCLDWLQSEAE